MSTHLHPSAGMVIVLGTTVYQRNHVGGSKQVGSCTSPEAAQAIARLVSDYQWPYENKETIYPWSPKQQDGGV